MNVEIIDFTRPDSSRKNLFVTNLPTSIHQDDIVVQLHDIFDRYGLVYGVQVYRTQWKSNTETEHTTTVVDTCSGNGYYGFVTFYSAIAATKAKEDVNGKIYLDGTECKVNFAKRKRDVDDRKQLYFTKCHELINFFLGFNGWSTNIKTLFEDKDGTVETPDTKTIKFVCMIELHVRDLNTDGIGVWTETFPKTEPMARIQAYCKCKKICHQKAIENAFSKVLLVILGNGKVSVEINTLIPEFRTEPDEQLIKVNNLDDEPETDSDGEITESYNTSKLSTSNIDDINLHILQQLEDDM